MYSAEMIFASEKQNISLRTADNAFYEANYVMATELNRERPFS